MKNTKKLKSLLSIMIAATALTSAANADTFGIAGGNGGFGVMGTSGASGSNAVINVSDGHSQILDLRGQNGLNGGSGGAGGYASSCGHTRGAFDLFGADGGNGGNAGSGGNGGNGGNAIIYYTNVAQLKNILIDSTPGAGGRSGIPGVGGPACGCDVYSWTAPIQECHSVTTQPPHAAGQPVPAPVTTQVCTTDPHTFTCRDGDHGRPGLIGSNGQNGAPGTLTLIQSATALTAPEPTKALAISSLPAQATLSVDNWATAAGGLQLLAPGSIIQDTFRYYSGRRFVPITIDWNARLNKSLFDGYSIIASTDEAGRVSASASNGLWAQISVNPKDNGAEISVDRAVLGSQTTELSGSIQGSGSSTTVEITDAAQISDIVNTDMDVVVKSGGGFIGFIMVKRYDGSVPSNLITKSAGHLSVAIGKLPGIDAGKIGNKKIKVELSISRSLGGQGRSTDLNLQR